MIQSFKHKGLKLLYEKGSRKGVPPACAEKIENVLSVLDVAKSVASLKLPGLHPLKGTRKGEWGVTITGNWRVVFKIVEGHVCDVDYTDYH